MSEPTALRIEQIRARWAIGVDLHKGDVDALLAEVDAARADVERLRGALDAIVAEGWALEVTGRTGRTLIREAREALAGTEAPPDAQREEG